MKQSPYALVDFAGMSEIRMEIPHVIARPVRSKAECDENECEARVQEVLDETPKAILKCFGRSDKRNAIEGISQRMIPTGMWEHFSIRRTIASFGE